MADVSTQARKPRTRKLTKEQEQAAVYAERKAKYWGPERNAQRRERYAKDAEYAEQLRQTRRENYRDATGTPPPKSCIDNLPNVHDAGRFMHVAAFGLSATKSVYHSDDVAALLDRAPTIIYRWKERGLFPHPVLVGAAGGLFYGEAEVTNFVRILGEHQKRTPHYRIDHTAVRDALFEASFEHNPHRALAWMRQQD